MRDQYVTLVLIIVKVVSASIHNLEWTIQGAESVNYTMKVSPGDKLILRCIEGTFNSIDLVNKHQYDACSKHAGQDNGSLLTHYCSFGSYDVTFEIKPPHFPAGSTAYLTSFSNGTGVSCPERETDAGGQCTRGLKLAIHIGESNCSRPPLTNGLLLRQYTGELPGDVLYFQCPPPYYPTLITRSTCTRQGTWDPPAQCTRHCLIQPPPANSTFLNNATSFPGSVVTIKCKPGFTPSSPFRSTCSPSGNWIPSYINYTCTKTEANITMRMRNGLTHYVCTNHSLSFACQVRSNSHRLHLLWTIRVPGHPIRTIAMNQSNQIVQSSDNSIHSSVTNYSPRTHTMASNLHIRMPPAVSRYDSRAYVMCGVREATRRSYQLTYLPAPQSPANLTAKMSTWTTRTITTTLTWYQPLSHNTRNYTIRFAPRHGPNVLYYHHTRSSNAIRQFTCTMRVGREYTVSVTPYNCRGRGPSSNITLCTCPPPDRPINGSMSHNRWAEPSQTSRIMCPPGTQSSRNSATIKCTTNATWDRSSGGFYCEKEYASVGFTQDTYSVYEERGFVIITVKVFASNLITRAARVSLYTTSGTAKAPNDFLNPGDVLVSLNQRITHRHIKINIVKDRDMEDIKYFYCHLTTSDQAVRIVRRRAKVMIQDYQRRTSCEPPVPPINGRLGNYSASLYLSLHSDHVIYMCNGDSAIHVTTCRNGQWQPPPDEHNCTSATVSNHTAELKHGERTILSDPFVISMLIMIVLLVVLLLSLFFFLIVCYIKINKAAKIQRKKRRRRASFVPDTAHQEWTYGQTRRRTQVPSEIMSFLQRWCFFCRVDRLEDKESVHPTHDPKRDPRAAKAGTASRCRECRFSKKRIKEAATKFQDKVFSTFCSCLEFNIE